MCLEGKLKKRVCARKADITNLGKLKYSVKTGSDMKYRMLESQEEYRYIDKEKTIDRKAK